VALSQRGSSARRVAARRRIGKAGGAAGGISETPTQIDPCGSCWYGSRWLLKTSSGKIARAANREKYLEERER